MLYKLKKEYIPASGFHILLPVYDFVCSFLGFGKKFREKVLSRVRIKSENVILDVGCGTGSFFSVLKEKYPNVCAIGIDVDSKILKIARKKLDKFSGITLTRAEGESLPIRENSVDFVFSTLVFHHMPDDIKRKAIYEIYRVLKQDGKLIIADFGKIDNRWIRILLYPFRRLEYLDGNLKGLVIDYIQEAGFRNISVSRIKFLIDIIIAEK